MDKTGVGRFVFFVVAVLLGCIGSHNLAAQHPIADVAAIRESQIYEARRAIFTSGPSSSASTPYGSTEFRLTITSAAVPRMSKESSNRLKIVDDDRKTIAELHKIRDTNIFRLLKLPDCKGPFKNGADAQKCYFENYSIAHLANSFSFRAKRHDSRPLGDLTLRKDGFFSNPGFAVSFISSLGDVAIADLGLESEGVGYVAGFKPGDSVDKAAEQIVLFDKGIKNGKHNYSRGVRILKDITYVLRSVGYMVGKGSTGPAEDIIVAFRVVRMDDNGDVTVIWKELQRAKGIKLDQK
jgi:hypothetical protein